MPVPKRKRSRARRDKRFANKGLSVKSFTQCGNCQEFISPHQACSQCGFYKNEKVMKTKLDRGIKRLELQEKMKKAAPQMNEQAESQEN